MLGTGAKKKEIQYWPMQIGERVSWFVRVNGKIAFQLEGLVESKESGVLVARSDQGARYRLHEVDGQLEAGC